MRGTREECALAAVALVDPATVREMERGYERAKPRFMNKNGKVRNNWHKLSIRDMAEKVGGEKLHRGIYPFLSSLTHMDMMGTGVGMEDSTSNEPAQTESRLLLAIQVAAMSYRMALDAFDQIANLEKEKLINAASDEFRRAQR